MRDVLIKPTGQEILNKQGLGAPGTPFYHNCLPDTGCSASVIAANLVRTYGLVMDRYRFKPLKNVNGESVKVIGSVTFEVTYQDFSVEIVALVSPEIEEEVILSWRTLQKLGIITDRFPVPNNQAAVEIAKKRWKNQKSCQNRSSDYTHL